MILFELLVKTKGNKKSLRINRLENDDAWDGEARIRTRSGWQ